MMRMPTIHRPRTVILAFGPKLSRNSWILPGIMSENAPYIKTPVENARIAEMKLGPVILMRYFDQMFVSDCFMRLIGASNNGIDAPIIVPRRAIAISANP